MVRASVSLAHHLLPTRSLMNTPVVLITGALTGIGHATARAFAHEGARIVVSGRRDEAGQALAKELRALGAEAEYVQADVRHEDDVRSLVDQTVARFGRLDVAVNNAGTEGKPGPVTEQSADSYSATFETNVLGTLLSLKHELRVMLAQRHGSIVNLSSTLGHTGAPGTGVMSGTFTRSMPLPDGTTIPPTGKRFAIGMATIGHWVNGRMDHEWLFWDGGDFMKQLGLAK